MDKISGISNTAEFGNGNKTLAIDMGGSAIKAALLWNGKIMQEGLWRHDYRDSDLAAAKSDLLMKLKNICGSKADLVGLGIAGLLSKDGTLWRSTVLTSFSGFDIGQFVAKEFSATNYSQDNDADCGAIGEHHYAGSELLYVVIGSGIGSACVDSNGSLLYPVRIDRNVPFIEEMNHPISDIGLRLKISSNEMMDMFSKMGIKGYQLLKGMKNVRLGDLGSAIGVGNILKMLWKGEFFGKESAEYYGRYLEGKDEMIRDLFGERYAAKTIAYLAKKGEPRSVTAYKLMGRFLGKAISDAEKILYQDHGRYFEVHLAGNILDSGELFWSDMEEEISESGIRTDCKLSKAYLAGINPNLVGAYLRVNREVKIYG